MSEHIVETFGIVQDFADLHGDMTTPLYEAIMGVMLSRQREEIVRCRDCVHYQPDPNPIDPGWPMWCEDTGRDLVPPDSFCAWGERRETE